MSTNSFLGHDVDLERLAELTRNFSGAEIEGLVKSAASYALNRNVDINDLHKPLDEDNIKVCRVGQGCQQALLGCLLDSLRQRSVKINYFLSAQKCVRVI